MSPVDDILAKPDFPRNLESLASEFRARHGLTSIHQLGILVPNVRSAAGDLERDGIGPFSVVGGAASSWIERGSSRTVEGTIGLTYHRGIELELLEPAKGSEFYHLGAHPVGKALLHHLGFRVPDVDQQAEALAAQGYPVWVRGSLTVGALVAEFAYMDTVAELGLVLEFISWRLRGRRFEPKTDVWRKDLFERLLAIGSDST
jgi:hypothetical protein